MNIVMTGGSSGLGQQAVQRLTGMPDVRLLLGARRTASEGARLLPLDLASLGSVREFAGAVGSELGNEDIDVLLLNAGIQFSDLSHRTEDGFETTFGVNHLAHYLLLRLLLPKLADGATVILTTSDTHDPKTNPLGAPRTLDPEKLAHPPEGAKNGFMAGFRAYAASKLCDLLTARALATSQVALDRQLRVIAYNPGFTPGTGLNQTWPAWARIALTGGKALRPILRLNTVQDAGGALADLALARAVPPPARIYASLVRRHLTWPNPSELAQRDDVMHDLWDASARMIGLPPEL